MSINKLCQRLSVLTMSHVRPPARTTETVRNIHSSPACLKNFKSRIPRNLKIGLYRFDASVDPTKYTIKPIEVAKTGGRGPDGRIWIHKIGGGFKKMYRMIDFHRVGPKEGEPKVEKVYEVIKDDCRTANIALVAAGNHKRWILASENMKSGDLIKTSGTVTAMPVRAQEGDAHPVGSLPLGTLVHNIEALVGSGGTVARAAGTSGLYVRKVGDKCVIRMPSKRELVISQECMVTIGRVSNVEHHKTKKMRKAGENRWQGRRPHSGWWQRKTGYHGRKIKPLKAPMVVERAAEEAPYAHSFTF
ncbi:39S ribosomal protein L2, mitochondrial [Aplysia californica]|uniref:39S ribosomal protein L2, mitochondrial n=1 Tax=Aplysia californica TaxID=6500 RepID=A0ABM0JF38_APLCA|nr:39S ribosomal protein L2, mitochondrial [Aplysia californica]XP_012934629.1 39S ribosomal protein L2, mitochondrial [Aplysia californica]XP_035824048.1 39S ribosomal protein L2, mitochondrial [Aplysia californica]